AKPARRWQYLRMASPLARKLRSTPTDAEARLWSRLRRQQIDGFRFRRQQPMGRYVVDFFCPEAKLIVEVDGGQHATDSSARTRWLEGSGYRVIRFWNNEVLGNTNSVVEKIHEALRAAGTPHPNPPPQGGRENK
ncbi:MAG: endonuclease domain-containing protein, partial [Stellaceae bacterium]